MTEDELRKLAASMGFYLIRRRTTKPLHHKQTRTDFCGNGHSLADAYIMASGHLQCRTCTFNRLGRTPIKPRRTPSLESSDERLPL